MTKQSAIRRTTFGGLSRSELMSRIRSRRNETTELRMARALRRAKLTGWRRHVPLPGTPDFGWLDQRVLVFVHGCFWHGHSCGRNLDPQTNSREWRAKITRNQTRDARVARYLRGLGWCVMTIWECQLKRDADTCVLRIARRLASTNDSRTRSQGGRP